MNMVEHARLKTANDRLMTIAVAIVAHEKELGYGDNVYSTTDTTVEEIDRYIEITSGDYEIMENDLDKNTHTERTMKIELCIVTYEPSEKNADSFLSELQTLLNKYAI